jgi:hypothetical protein
VLPERTEENYKQPLSGWPVSWPKFESGTSQIRSGNTDHSVVTLGIFDTVTNKMFLFILYQLLMLYVVCCGGCQRQILTNVKDSSKGLLCVLTGHSSGATEDNHENLSEYSLPISCDIS